jgi:hypothetical protein
VDLSLHWVPFVPTCSLRQKEPALCALPALVRVRAAKTEERTRLLLLEQGAEEQDKRVAMGNGAEGILESAEVDHRLLVRRSCASVIGDAAAHTRVVASHDTRKIRRKTCQ